MSRVFFLAGIVLSMGGAACGAHAFTDNDGGTDAQSPSFDAAFPDVGIPPSDAGDGGCSNLECQVDLACSEAGNTETTITGTVYDPAGVTGLYGVFVYIPNGTPDPIALGVSADGGIPMVCSSCQAPASGSPIIGGFTDSQGHFSISRGPMDTWGVPTGSNIPLVIQDGKWRRQLVIPQVTSCAVNDLDSVPSLNGGTGTPQQEHQMRLPSKASEGDMPLIAFTSGYDPAECFLLHIGIDPSEFVPPGSTTGHVQFFTGKSSGGNGNGSQIPGGNTPLETYEWWTNPSNLVQFDIVFNACEGAANSRVPPKNAFEDPYVAMDTYLKSGGRLFATHFYENWFTQTSTPDLETAAQWDEWGMVGGAGISETESVDQTFPKGVALANWLVYAGASTTLGEITLTDTRDDVLGQLPTGCSTASGTCYSTQWLVHPGDNHPRYISFNTPVGVPTAPQCGRAVLSDVHLSGTSTGDPFPDECAMADPAYAANEKALEFLFFDLASCVQDDSKPPIQPN
jgi:hypothetical protein